MQPPLLTIRDARGQRLLLARGNGLMTRYAYDAVSLRLRRLRTEGYATAGETLSPLSGSTRQDTAYTYDLAGNITATQERAPQSGVGGAAELERLFEYDALYRLLSATGRENQPTAATPWQDETRSDGVASTTRYTQHYEYDLLGNIKQLRHVGQSRFTRTFAYGSQATNYLQSVQVGGTVLADYAYDANGNVLRETQGRHLSWDAADQLRQFATWTGTAGTAPTLLAYYVYDAGGQRTKKITQTSADTWQVSVYVGGGFEHRYEVSAGTPTGEQTVVAVLDGQSRLYQRRAGDALGDQRPAELYTLEDHLGSATATVDGAGAVVSREEYYPFGETSFGAHAKQRYHFCGKERDQENGLYYYGMRYYAPWLCRFVSVDPIASKYTYYTPYQYAGNKPVISVDIDGLEGNNDNNQQVINNKSDSNQGSTLSLPLPQSQVGALHSKPVIEKVWDNSLGGLIVGAYKSLSDYSEKANSKAQHLLFIMDYVNGGNPPSLGDKAAAYAHAYLSGGAANYTDQDDVAVLKTGKHFDNTQASTLDKGLAVAGAVVPFVAGSVIKKLGQEASKELKTIGLGVDRDLARHGTDAITYRNAKWQNSGLTNIEWSEVKTSVQAFKDSFYQASKNADAIRFDVTNFNPRYAQPGTNLTLFEFRTITGSPELMSKTTFISNGVIVKWDGVKFVKP